MAVSGIVASLSLAVALTVMVSSFRHSVTLWLDSMLPAAMYLRTGTSAYLDPAFVQAAAEVAGVQRLRGQHTEALNLVPSQPSVTLLARPLHDTPTAPLNLPLLHAALPIPPDCVGIYVSEAVIDLYRARIGTPFVALQSAFPVAHGSAAPCFYVAGVWRDYARQFGSIAMDLDDYAHLRGPAHINDLALWLQPDADPAAVEQKLRTLANQLAKTPDGSAADLLEFATTTEIRTRTLRLFDRSFAVTYWLQTVAIGIGLFGVAASFSAQVLARRKEFGLLVHLGLTTRQILQLLAAEALVWTCLGSLAGVGLGLLVSEVLVRVVNPQSFHWTMDLSIPWLRLLWLGLAVVGAGTLTAWLAGRAAASADVVRAVREDW
jgi:putative ABC transport system permease protein